MHVDLSPEAMERLAANMCAIASASGFNAADWERGAATLRAASAEIERLRAYVDREPADRGVLPPDVEPIINRIHESKAGIEVRAEAIRTIQSLVAENKRLRAYVDRERLRSFDEAFSDARARGAKTFTFRGAEYHTRTADEDRAALNPEGEA